MNDHFYVEEIGNTGSLKHISLKDDVASFFLSIMSYGLIFWGTSTHSEYIFKLQKRIIRVIKGARIRDSCREFFKILKILPLSYQSIFSLAVLVVNNKVYSWKILNYIISKLGITPIFINHLHIITIYQKGPYYIGIKVPNNLPAQIKVLPCNFKQFKTAVMYFLQIYPFYTSSENFSYNKNPFCK